jgi:hypothetical protein
MSCVRDVSRKANRDDISHIELDRGRPEILDKV